MAVLSQDYPRHLFEVIAVDGMSEDGTRETLLRLAAKDSRLKILDNPRKIIPVALNLGIRAAHGEFIMRVDGHSILPPYYLCECLEVLRGCTGHSSGQSNGILAAASGAWDCLGSGRVGDAIAIATSSRFGIGNPAYRTASAALRLPLVTDSAPFWVMPRFIFERIGLFHEEMSCHEDYELNSRLRRAGGRILLLPWVRATYLVRGTIQAVGRQYCRYGFWKGRFVRSCPQSLKPRHCIPPLFSGALLFTAVASLVSHAATGLFSALVGLYLVYLLFATLVLTASRRPRSALTVLLLPVVLLVVHLSWGTGVWLGLFRGPVSGSPPQLGQSIRSGDIHDPSYAAN